MDKIPVGWQQTVLSDVCKKIEKINSKSRTGINEFIYVDINSVDNNKNIIADPKIYKWSEAPSRAQQILANGDVVFSTVRTYMKNIALVHPSLQDAIASTGFCVLRPKDILNNKYLFYYTLCDFFLEPLNKLQRGSSYPAVRNSDVLAQKIVFPSVEEQQRIVDKIEELFSELDAAVAGLKEAERQLQTYRQSVLKYAFEGKFTGGMGGWVWKKIGQVLDTINNGYTPSSSKMTDSGPVQFLKVYNLNFDGTLNYRKNPVFISREVHETELKRSRTYAGDVVINIVGPPLGKVSLIPDVASEFNINQAMVLFRPNDKAKSKFLMYYLMCPQVINWLEGTSKATAGQYNVKVSTCREILFPEISRGEQQKIVSEIELRLSESDQLLKTIQQQLTQADALRQSILQRAFRGSWSEP